MSADSGAIVDLNGPAKQTHARNCGVEPKTKRVAGTIVGRDRLDWRGDTLLSTGRIVARLVGDETWPGIWRVCLSSGNTSDMVNLSRARDAAEALVLKLMVQETARDGRLCVESGEVTHDVA